MILNGNRAQRNEREIHPPAAALSRNPGSYLDPHVEPPAHRDRLLHSGRQPQQPLAVEERPATISHQLAALGD